MIVYKITNIDNGKIYIGQTKFSLEKRFKEHAKADSYLGYAIRQHGEDHFKREVLATCETREKAYALEMRYIAEFDCMAPNGYNLTPGGAYRPKGRKLGTGWTALYQDMIFNIAQWNLPNEQNRVFMALIGKVNFENYLTINQSELSQALSIKQPNISKAIKGRNFPVARFMLAASVASPLLKVLGERNFLVYVNAPTRASKTTALYLGGLAGEACEFNDYPFFIDEKQVADSKIKNQLDLLVYALANGIGRTKLNRDSTLNRAPDWRTIPIMTGET